MKPFLNLIYCHKLLSYVLYPNNSLKKNRKSTLSNNLEIKFPIHSKNRHHTIISKLICPKKSVEFPPLLSPPLKASIIHQLRWATLKLTNTPIHTFKTKLKEHVCGSKPPVNLTDIKKLFLRNLCFCYQENLYMYDMLTTILGSRGSSKTRGWWPS